MGWLKVIAKLLLGLVAVLALAIGLLVWQGHRLAGKRWDIAIPARAPAATIDLAEGARIAQIRGCTGCHAKDLGGEVLAETPIGDLVPPNLTTGKGGVTAGYADADWERSIRHGVSPKGRALILMPSDDNTRVSEADFAQLLAYLKSVPAVDRALPPTRLTPLGYALLGAGQLPLLAVERIDHSLQPAAPTVAADAAYGAYLAHTCSGCHGNNFAGGPIPGMPPGAPPAANLTPAGRLPQWTLGQFGTAVRTGARPDGTRMDEHFMPWPAFAAMTDIEVEALYRHFGSLPKAERRN
ncbi:MAG: c-type cytochrome [Xanthomonadales bacterium]|nr:hypothetical protein [Xanthomonadales bacterium]MCC6594010.1 c-type cytochrome [Xanthomonadales bacterium]